MNNSKNNTNELPNIVLAVCGAHMRDLPLNGQLLELGAFFLRTAKTAPMYRFIALSPVSTLPERPGLIRVEQGISIDLELWSVPLDGIGRLLSQIAPPLGLGTLELDDSTSVKGFICEGYALKGSEDISDYGSWRKWIGR
jgi:allophanate hydrolase